MQQMQLQMLEQMKQLQQLIHSVKLSTRPDPETSNLQTNKRHEVDAVILYLNGSDPKWQQTYYHDHPGTEIDGERFISFGEIYLCIGALHREVPWLRKIFIVIATQSQRFPIHPFVPELHKKIVFVTHSEMGMPHSALPTYSSAAIDTMLHGVPGLAEHFLYLNDDLMIKRKLTYDGTFQRGSGKMFAVFEHPETTEDELWNERRNDRRKGRDWHLPYKASGELIARTLGLRPTKSKHSIMLQTKTDYTEAWQLWPKQLNHTLHSRVRPYNTLDKGGFVMMTFLSNYLGLARGRRALVLDPTSENKGAVGSGIDTLQASKLYRYDVPGLCLKHGPKSGAFLDQYSKCMCPTSKHRQKFGHAWEASLHWSRNTIGGNCF